LIERITNGFQTSGSPMAMPPKGGNASLTAQDISDVLAYIRQRFGGFVKRRPSR
jgi:cytochrome c5